jgi:branched-chain amino acid aminotransferase
MIWINSGLTSAAEVQTLVSDRGWAHGYGVFETLADRGDGPQMAEKHWLRLKQGCQRLGLPCPDFPEFHQILTQLTQANGLDTARLRISVTGTDHQEIANVIATASPLQIPVGPAKVVTSPYPLHSQGALRGVKSTCYAEYLISLRHAQTHGADEALILNERQELSEGATSNVFIVTSGKLTTPGLTSGCLPGIVRALVIEACHNLSIPIIEGPIMKQQLVECDEAFLTSSIKLIQAISTIDHRPLRTQSSPQTDRIRQELARLIAIQ